MMRILNFGSLNIDYVYEVKHLVLPGETLTSKSFTKFAGGKGANQSAALAKAGASVLHAGKIGRDGLFLKEKLSELGCDTTLIETSETEINGHAIIQVNPEGENAIILYPGSNRTIESSAIDRALEKIGKGDILLLQNEISRVSEVIQKGKKRGVTIALNPAPMDALAAQLPLELIDILIVNEVECAEYLGVPVRKSDYQAMAAQLKAKLNVSELIVTLGSQGVIYHGIESFYLPARPVKVVDTTAAGDTFIGYFLAGKAQGLKARESVKRAMVAAEICVGIRGAMASIPDKAAVDALWLEING